MGYVVTPACFPPDLRGAGFGLASAGSKLGLLIAPLIVGALMNRSVIALGAFFTGSFACAALFLSLVPHRDAHVESSTNKPPGDSAEDLAAETELGHLTDFRCCKVGRTCESLHVPL